MPPIISTAVVPFLGSEIVPDYDTAKVVILPIPYEATTTYRRGCENGPAKLLADRRYPQQPTSFILRNAGSHAKNRTPANY